MELHNKAFESNPINKEVSNIINNVSYKQAFSIDMINSFTQKQEFTLQNNTKKNTMKSNNEAKKKLIDELNTRVKEQEYMEKEDYKLFLYSLLFSKIKYFNNLKTDYTESNLTLQYYKKKLSLKILYTELLESAKIISSSILGINSISKISKKLIITKTQFFEIILSCLYNSFYYDYNLLRKYEVIGFNNDLVINKIIDNAERINSLYRDCIYTLKENENYQYCNLNLFISEVCYDALNLITSFYSSMLNSVGHQKRAFVDDNYNSKIRVNDLFVKYNIGDNASNIKNANKNTEANIAQSEGDNDINSDNRFLLENYINKDLLFKYPLIKDISSLKLLQRKLIQFVEAYNKDVLGRGLANFYIFLNTSIYQVLLTLYYIIKMLYSNKKSINKDKDKADTKINNNANKDQISVKETQQKEEVNYLTEGQTTIDLLFNDIKVIDILKLNLEQNNTNNKNEFNYIFLLDLYQESLVKHVKKLTDITSTSNINQLNSQEEYNTRLLKITYLLNLSLNTSFNKHLSYYYYDIRLQFSLFVGDVTKDYVYITDYINHLFNIRENSLNCLFYSSCYEFFNDYNKQMKKTSNVNYTLKKLLLSCYDKNNKDFALFLKQCVSIEFQDENYNNKSNNLFNLKSMKSNRNNLLSFRSYVDSSAKDLLINIKKEIINEEKEKGLFRDSHIQTDHVNGNSKPSVKQILLKSLIIKLSKTNIINLNVKLNNLELKTMNINKSIQSNKVLSLIFSELTILMYNVKYNYFLKLTFIKKDIIQTESLKNNQILYTLMNFFLNNTNINEKTILKLFSSLRLKLMTLINILENIIYYKIVKSTLNEFNKKNSNVSIDSIIGINELINSNLSFAEAILIKLMDTKLIEILNALEVHVEDYEKVFLNLREKAYVKNNDENQNNIRINDIESRNNEIEKLYVQLFNINFSLDKLISEGSSYLSS